MSRKVQTQDNFVPGKGHTPDPELSSEDLTERDGYRDTSTIVNEFVRAGERLAQFRKEEFDTEAEDFEMELPIERRNDFEMADASMLLESEAKRIAMRSVESEYGKKEAEIEKREKEEEKENGST